MRYVLLLMGDGDVPEWTGMTKDEQAGVIERFSAFDAACRERDGVQIVADAALGGGDTATVVRTRDGVRTVTDGPYAEATEQIGGFYLLEAPDLDVVLELTELLPPYDLQISPVVDPY